MHRELVERMLDARPRARQLRHRRRRAERAPARTTTRATRVIDDGDVVLCDFGGTMARLLLRHHPHVRRGRADRRGARRLRRARRRRRKPACAPRPSARRARTSTPPPARVITDAGYGDCVRAPHRSRHRHRGARGSRTSSPATRRRSSPGHAFSIEPGIYFPGRFGMRLEDIVVATDDGPERLNHARARPRRRRLSRIRDDSTSRPCSCSGRPAGSLFCWVTTRRRRGGPRLRLAAAQRRSACLADARPWCRASGESGTGAHDPQRAPPR